MLNSNNTNLVSQIVYNNDGFLVLNKPAGILSQKDKSGTPDAAELLKSEFQRSGQKVTFLAPVHRLDRNTSGLLLLARNPKTAASLTELLQRGEIKRVYLAIVKGSLDQSGIIDKPLLKDSKTNEVSVSPKGLPAITSFRKIESMGNSSLVAVNIQTGRSHQIRVHFASENHALLGDKKYAKPPWSEIFGRPALHAALLKIEGEKTFEAPIPDDMQNLLKKLGSKLSSKEILRFLHDEEKFS